MRPASVSPLRPHARATNAVVPAPIAIITAARKTRCRRHRGERFRAELTDDFRLYETDAVQQVAENSG
jgi:hypothetical protein